MKTEIDVTDRLIGLVERIELVDKLYGITEEDREVLDVIRGVKDLKTEEELDNVLEE